MIKKILLAAVLTCGILGTWQVYRFFYKQEIIYRIKKCKTKQSIGDASLYCNLSLTRPILDKKAFFLFKDIDHSYLLLTIKVGNLETLLNLGYVNNHNKVDIQNVINNEQFVGFDAIIAPTKTNKHLLVKNNFEKRELYSLDIKKINAKLGLKLSQNFLIAYSNTIAKNNKNLIASNPKPKIRLYIHIGYALMWYFVFVFGVICMSVLNKRF